MKTLLVSTLLGMIIFSSLVFATGSLSITSVTIPTSVSTGDSFTITVSISGTEVQSDQATGSLTLPTGLSCTQGSQTITLSGGTGSATWDCSADVAGDYTSQITASVTGTDSGTGGTLSDSEQTGLTVLSPASLTVSSTINTSSMAVSAAAQLTVGVNNVGDQSTTYNITISCLSGLTCTPSSVATNTIEGTTLENNVITITASAAGNYTITATVSGNSQTLNTSQSLTVTGTASTTTTTVSGGDGGSTGGGGGGGGGTTPTTKKKSQTWDKITPGSATIMHVDDPDIGLKMINITVRNPAQTVTITVTKLAGQPATVIHTVSGKVYKYIEINHTNLPDNITDKIKVQFQVNKTWMNQNKINRATIALNRYKDNVWQKLSTKEIIEDADYVNYEAETPGFSTFAVTGEETSITTAITTTSIIATTTHMVATTTTIPTSSPVENLPVIPILIIIVVIGIVAFFIFRGRKSTT